MKVAIDLQPKQAEIHRLIEDSKAVVIGVGGGRGAAKSSGADRVAITLMYEHPGLAVCMVMRTWVKQMVPFHLEPIRRYFPWLAKNLRETPPAVLRIGKSRMEFKYAETYEDVVEAFRSGNYDLVFIDQAEQFTGREIREIRKACRSVGKRTAKIVLLFNMRGANVHELRKWFRDKELNPDESPEDYVFLKVNPWDNVEWVRQALDRDGYTERDFYHWTDEQRMNYAARNGDYTRQLATDDEAIRAADWYGGWDAIEGAYFSNSFDLEKTRIPSSLVERMRRNWATHWIGQDWGKAHYCVTYWNFRVTLKPSEVTDLLGWKRETPLNVTVTYREMVVNERTSQEVARLIIESTPPTEREKHKSYFLSPEAVTDDPHSIGYEQTLELRKAKMPAAQKANNDRKGGWGLMDKLLRATKNNGMVIDDFGGRREAEDVWLISSECAELLKSIPLLMRDPKDIDDVLKTDKTTAKLEQDVGDGARYSVVSMLLPRKKSKEEEFQEEYASMKSGADRMMSLFRHDAKKRKQAKLVLPPSWAANVRKK